MSIHYVAYARVSTSEQAERGKSIEDQLAKLEREAGQRGGVLLRTFADPGFSGSNLNRPQLSALLSFCREQDVDAVLVVDTDRLARKTEHHFAIKAQLRKCGVRVESLNQPMIDDTPEGVFLDTILAATNALFLRSRDERPASRWRKRCRRDGGRDPLGSAIATPTIHTRLRPMTAALSFPMRPMGRWSLVPSRSMRRGNTR